MAREADLYWWVVMCEAAVGLTEGRVELLEGQVTVVVVVVVSQEVLHAALQ